MSLRCLLSTAFAPRSAAVSCGAAARRTATSSSGSAAAKAPATYRDLSAFDPMLDLHDLQAHSPASVARVDPQRPHPRATDGPLAPTVLHLNDPPPFQPTPPPSSALFSAQDAQPHRLAASRLPGLTSNDVRDMHRYVLVVKRVSTMTAKGRTASWYALVVTGNGEGVVGLGEGKGDTLISASDKGFVQALRNMIAIERFDRRTLWTTRVGKIGGVSMTLWQRPPGFGLRVHPIVHQIAKAAGITDLAGKVLGKNKMHIGKLCHRLLQASSNPVGFGDGFGGRGHRSDKGIGMRTADDVGRVLGRRPVYP